MKALIERSKNYNVVGAVTNKPNAPGIALAHESKVPVTVVDHTPYDNREEFEAHLISAINQYLPDLVVLAGFMRILTPTFTNYYDERCINIHPSLLPKYRGLNTYQRALDAGDQYAGFTIHHVTAELDGGQQIYQHSERVLDDDDVESLSARVKVAEQFWYPNILNILSQKVIMQ